MNDLAKLFGIQEPETDTEIATTPMPMWTPVHDDRAIERVTKRVIQRQDGTMIFEEETIYLRYEQVDPDPKPEGPYTFYTHYASQAMSIEVAEQMVADYESGRAVWDGGPNGPHKALRDARRRAGYVEMNNGRIVLDRGH